MTCGAALVATGGAFTGHGRSVEGAGERADERACNEAMFLVHRVVATTPYAPQLPAACAVDREALWQAVGSPRQHCEALARCGETVRAMDDPGLDHEQIREASSRARGFAGEVLCARTAVAVQAQLSEAGKQIPDVCF
ncbi:MAG: hypothetical protein M3680_18870 [Myxococcota bacterium]|nr:hypothetical protein [Myxococcota bacterium]